MFFSGQGVTYGDFHRLFQGLGRALMFFQRLVFWRKAGDLV